MNEFIKYISDELNRFSMLVKDYKRIADDIYELKIVDTYNNVKYIALSKKTAAEKPSSFWRKLIDTTLIQSIKNSEDKVTFITVPALIITPSSEVNYIIDEMLKKGLRPGTYELFEGYTVIGFKRKETELIISSKKIKEPLRKKIVKERKKSNIPKYALITLLSVLLLTSAAYGLNQLKYMLSDERKIINKVVIDAINGTPENKNILSSLAENADMTRYEYLNLYQNGYAANIAKNPHISERTANRIMMHPDPLVRASLAQNSSISKEIADKLAEDTSPIVRAAAASNPKLTNQQLKKLSEDKEYMVRTGVLDNPNLTDDLLDNIEPNPNTASCNIKEKVYARSSLFEDLEYHAQNPDPCIRRGVAKNNNTKSSIIDKLADDPDLKVKVEAISNANLSQNKLKELNNKYIKSNENINNEIAIKNALFKNPNQSNEILEQAFSDIDLYGASIAQNPALDKKHIKKLYNSSLPKGGINTFINNINSMTTDEKLLIEISEEKARLGDKWKDNLRKNINRQFSDNIYDPIFTGRAIDKQELLNDDETKKLSLYNLTDEGSFFEDSKSPIQLSENIDNFESFFQDNGKKSDEIAKTADEIVDEVMKELVPAMENALNRYEHLNSPNNINNGDITSFILDDLQPLNDKFKEKSLRKLEALK